MEHMKRIGKQAASVCLSMALVAQLCAAAPAGAAQTNGWENGKETLDMTQIARYTSGQYNVDGGVMEIVAYNAGNGFAYAVNGQSGKLAAISLGSLEVGAAVSVLTASEIDVRALVEAKDTKFHYGDMTSVAVSPDQSTLAVALQAEGYADAGRVAIFTCGADGSLTLKGLVETGIQPDMVTFASDSIVLTADEGEPREGYGEGIIDPKGSVTVVDTAAMTGTVVGFDSFDGKRDELTKGGVVLKKGTAPSVDLEPEYIAVSGGKAYVTLQEANAVAVLDLASKSFDGVWSIGFEDHSKTPVDLDKKDDVYAPKTYEGLLGIRMPDAVAACTIGGETYLITANEGDSREWGDEDAGTAYLNEDERDFGDGEASPAGAITAEGSALEGKVVFFDAQDYDGLEEDKDYLFGGRSATIFRVAEDGLEQVFTTGDSFEALTAAYLPDNYNCSNDNAVLDDRSGKKGPEPESVTLGQVDGRTYAFVALERTGGIMIFDMTDPAQTTFVNYINTRDFDAIVEGSEVYEDGELDKWVTGGDVAPEGLAFVDAAVSPTGQALLLAACEVSGTVAVYQVGGEDQMVFSDVSDGVWYEEAVGYVAQNGLMGGTGNGVFSPNAPATRVMIVTTLHRMAGSPEADQSTFTDIPAGQWYAEAVAWASDNGIVSGRGDGTFGPDDSITREQLVLMLYRMEGSPTAQGDLSAFSDAGQVSSYAADAMAWAVETGLISGSDGVLDPQGLATRAQVAVILMRFSQSRDA